MKIFTINTKQIARMFSALVAILLISVQLSSAQSQSVRGVVLDESSNPIIGANVIIQGTTSGVTTGIDGDFVINVAPNQVLEFSYVGYRTVEETISAARTNIEILLMPAAVDLEEVVVVGYNTQSRITMTGSVSSVKAEELETLTAGAGNISNALTGQMPGVTVQQSSGWAGETSASITIRGTSSDSDNDPLVLVDGFERDLNDLDMSEVESISVLKDASSTAVYGVRGANGVIIITTKQGENNEKIRFNFKAEGGVNVLSKTPDMMNSWQWAEMYNEGLLNDNYGTTLTAAELGGFSDDDIQKYKDGSSPLSHPNNDLRDWAFNKAGYSQKYTLTMQGGSKAVTYFNSIAYSYQKDALKNHGQGYDASSWYDRINVRSNVTAKLTETTTLGLNLSAQFSTTNRPNVTLTNIQSYMCAMPTSASPGIIDNAVVLLDIDDTFWGNVTPGNNFYEIVYDTGYTKAKSNRLQATLSLKQDFSFLAKGLTGDVYFAYDNNNSTTFSWNHAPEIYKLISVDPITYTLSGQTAETTQSRSNANGAVYMKFRTMLNYNKKFNNAHNLSALAVFNLTDESFHSDSGSEEAPYRTLEVASKISYNYKSRYLADINLGVSGSENFDPSNRYGFFPAASVGWIATNEKWFPQNNVLNLLKFKGSYGITGNDGTSSRFSYLGSYTDSSTGTGGYKFGSELSAAGQGVSVLATTANPDLSWEKNYQTNIGISTQWFSSRLNVEAEVYRNDRKDILMTPETISEMFGLTAAMLGQINMKELQAQGYEVSANWSDNVGKFNYSIGGSIAYYENKIIEMGELTPTYEHQVQTGKAISQYYGYKFDGFYTQAEIDQLAANNYVGTPELPIGCDGLAEGLQAGDAKYVDYTGDGQITSDDMIYHDALTVPPYTFTINGSLNYKNWGLSMLWQGTSGGYYEYAGLIRTPFQAGRNNTALCQYNRWTPETADTATMPRMTAYGAQSSHNYYDSDMWLDDNKYIRLKNVELSYKFSSDVVKKLRLSSMRIYASGTNLLTFTALDFCDPETTSGSASIPIPPNKVFTLGVQIGF